MNIEESLKIDLNEIQAALYKIVREKVYQGTKDVPNWELALKSVYWDISNEIENWQSNKEVLTEDKLSLNTLETEGYIRGLIYCRRLIEETLKGYKLTINILN